MKFFTKALIILAVILLILALGDSIFNGLFNNDGYRREYESFSVNSY